MSFVHPKIVELRKIHLGCGQKYLSGYVNIDFPISEHTVQERSLADVHHDLLELRLNAASLDEIRLHHVFEHFPRPVALALLAAWARWLRPGGKLHVEVPDFTRTALSVLNPLKSDRARRTGLRHLFGSNEAEWATHYEGWTRRNFVEAAKFMGFPKISVQRSCWQNTFNIEFFAVTSDVLPSRDGAVRNARQFLKGFTLDDSVGELRLLDIWIKEFQQQLEKSWPEESH